MRGISRRKFAELEGCCEGTVRYAVRKGTLPTLSDGTIDLALTGTNWRVPRGATPKSEKTNSNSDYSSSSDQSKSMVGKETGTQCQSSDLGNNVVELFMEAKTRKEIALAKLRELEVLEKQRTLVDSKTVEQTVAAIAQRERDALMVWPSSVAGSLALDLGVDMVKLRVLLEDYIRQFLTERSKQGMECSYFIE